MQHHMIEIPICAQSDISTFQGLCVGEQAFIIEAPDMKKNVTQYNGVAHQVFTFLHQTC